MIKRVMSEEWLRPIRAFVKMAYGTPTAIMMPDADGYYYMCNDMQSTQGVRQGDPLGSLLFAVSLQPALETISDHIQEQGYEAAMLAYHDDTEMIGKPDHLIDLLPVVENELAKIDLKLQTSKSRLIDFHWQTRPADLKHAIQQLGIPVDDECGVLLGCPIGKTTTHEQSFMSDKLNQQMTILDRLADPRISMHQAATILRVSTIHKLDHWMRNVDPEVMQPLAQEFDDRIRQCFYAKLNLSQQINTASRNGQRSQIDELISTTVSLGGDGLTRMADTVHTCWVAGVACAMTVPTMFDAFPQFDDGQPRPNSMIHSKLDNALKVVTQQCYVSPNMIRQSQSQAEILTQSARSHRNHAPSSGASRSAAVSDDPDLTRCDLPTKAHELFRLMSGANQYAGSKAATFLFNNIRARQRLALKCHRRLQEYRASNLTRARLMAIRTKGATRIMQLAGGRVGSAKVHDLTYQAYFCLRHGIPLSLTHNEQCSGCGHNIIHVPHHELGCVIGFNNEVYARHNLIRNTVERTMTNIGGVTCREPNPFQDTNKRPDIEWIIDGRRIYFDISVTHPLNSTIVAKAANKKLAAAEHKEKIKNAKYLDLCERIDAEFIPIVIETFGGYGPQFNLFLKDLHNIARTNLTLIDGDSIIDEMLNQIAFHVISLNGLIMKKASSNGV